MLAPISAQNRMPRDSVASFASAVAQMWTATGAQHGNANREGCKVGAELASITVVSLNSKSRSTKVNVKCSNSHLFWTSRNKSSQGIKLLPADWYSIVNSQSWNKPQIQRWSWSYSDFSLLSMKIWMCIWSPHHLSFLLRLLWRTSLLLLDGQGWFSANRILWIQRATWTLTSCLLVPQELPQLQTEKKSSELSWPSTHGSTTIMMSWQVDRKSVV